MEYIHVKMWFTWEPADWQLRIFSSLQSTRPTAGPLLRPPWPELPSSTRLNVEYKWSSSSGGESNPWEALLQRHPKLLRPHDRPEWPTGEQIHRWCLLWPHWWSEHPFYMTWVYSHSACISSEVWAVHGLLCNLLAAKVLPAGRIWYQRSHWHPEEPVDHSRLLPFQRLASFWQPLYQSSRVQRWRSFSQRLHSPWMTSGPRYHSSTFHILEVCVGWGPGSFHRSVRLPKEYFLLVHY